MQKLKKCPCCGNDEIRVVKYPAQENEVFTYFSDRYAIQCEDTGDEKGCGLESGHFKDEGEAVYRWNMRTTSNSEYKQCQDKTHSDLEGYICPACGSNS